MTNTAPTQQFPFLSALTPAASIPVIVATRQNVRVRSPEHAPVAAWGTRPTFSACDGTLREWLKERNRLKEAFSSALRSVSPRLWSLEPWGHIAHEAPRISVVEDEYLIALQLDTELRTAGYRVMGPVPDIDGALELLKADRPDAAILDVNLAGEWVTPIAEKLKAMSVPFILASSYVAADLQADPVLRDAVNVGKFWRPEYILKALRAALDRT